MIKQTAPLKAFKLLICIFITALLLSACTGKSKKKMTGEEAITVADFIEFFDEITLPQQLSDTMLAKKNNDSALIANKVFSQFIPDSVFSKLYGKDMPKIYAMGRFRNKDQETYLLFKTKGVKARVNAIYMVAFTPENQYAAVLPLLSDSKKANEINSVSMDQRFTFTVVDQYRDAGGSITEYSAVYAYNTAGVFMVILRNGLQKGEKKEILNPIDTLPALNKFSGDYGRDDRNFITIRDGKSSDHFIFYINFDKGAASDCQAELKGEAKIIGKDSALYQDKDDPCTIGFKFGTKSVSITELTICGNQRPTACSFNAYYKKLIPPKPKAANNTKSKPTVKKSP